jgi:glycosyltransferase involved in cell wall biosynthesis
LRIAFLTPDWTPNGGVATHVRAASAALAQAGCAVQVLHRDASDGTAPAGVLSTQLDGYGGASGRWPDAPRVRGAMEHLYQFRPDVLHIHGFNDVALQTAALREFPALKTLHVYDFCPSGTKFHHATDRVCTFGTSMACVARQGYLRCTLSKRPSVWWSQYRRTVAANERDRAFGRIFVASQFVKDEAVRTGYDARTVDVLPYFTTLPAPVPAPLPRHVLFVGRLTREKGVDLLLQALARLTGEWSCTIAGDGVIGDDVRAAVAAPPFAGKVRVTGWLTEAALSAEFARASVVVVPSRWPEPFGIVGIEAMAHSRPVVAFRTGGIPEWLDDGATGWLVPPMNPAAFAARLQSLLDRPDEAAAMGARGRARVERDFVAAPHVHALLAAYGDACAR